MFRVGEHVERAGAAAGAEQSVGDRVSDQRGAVDLGREREWLQHAADREPGAAEVHLDPTPAGSQPVDAEPLGGDGAEHDDRIALAGRVQEAPLGDRAAECREQPEVGRVHADTARFSGFDVGGASHRG